MKNKRTRTSTSSPIATNEAAVSLSEFRSKVERGQTVGIGDVASILLAIHDSLETENRTRHDDLLELCEESKVRIEENKSKIEENEQRINSHNDRLEVLEKRMLATELRSINGCLILRGLKQHTSAVTEKKAESTAQTNELITNLFKELQIDDKITSFKARRFRQSTDTKITTATDPLVKLRLDIPSEKRFIFAALAKLKPKDISIDNEYPLMVKKEMQEARNKAYQIRKDSGNTIKARAEIRNMQVVVLQLKPGEKKFSIATD